ncbi:hypothetical protein PF005_g8599 [Phytophthora fragariae]|nr:hypothetical protein PF003_g28390 [Phytophthora fragariae]KAE9010706.1 hypothetical protein PR001_g16099 [Phytophthora rubi]KAE8941658.1 hypothetical protein PF009_g8562 [Phytophthora fragariae]KAE9004952.1 hypothetical protein PF011_g12244 [Phytophthora fragariae]KAE9033775.1 hypothetical protein PR002_g8493 [Phytophthora rubi]
MVMTPLIHPLLLVAIGPSPVCGEIAGLADSNACSGARSGTFTANPLSSTGSARCLPSTDSA